MIILILSAIFSMHLAPTVSASGLIIENDSSSQVINRIESRSETGGNTVINGRKVEGQAKSEIKIKTYIDGQLIEDIDKTSTSTGDSSVDVKSRVESDGSRAKSTTEIKVNDQPAVKTEKEVPLKKATSTAEEGGESRIFPTSTEDNGTSTETVTTTLERTATKTKDVVLSFWRSFVASLKNFFKF